MSELATKTITAEIRIGSQIAEAHARFVRCGSPEPWNVTFAKRLELPRIRVEELRREEIPAAETALPARHLGVLSIASPRSEQSPINVAQEIQVHKFAGVEHDRAGHNE